MRAKRPPRGPERWSALISLYLSVVLLHCASSAGAQDAATSTKGASSSFSRFRESIASVQRAQAIAEAPPPPQIVISTSSQQSSSSKTQQVQQQSSEFDASEAQADAEPSAFGSVAGKPGVDFPAYTSIPNTQFSCQGAPFEPGMYADESTGCQVYHLCHGGRRESFLCGLGTLFNQAILGCDFWYSVECRKSSQFYRLNSDFGKSSAEPAAGVAKFQAQKQIVEAVKQRPVGVVEQNVASISSYQSSGEFGGKVSPPKRPVLGTDSSASSFSSSSGGGGGGKTGLRKELRLQQQRVGALVSPSQRLAQQADFAQQQQQQFASESSTQIKLAKMGSDDGSGNSLETPASKVSASAKGDHLWRPYSKASNSLAKKKQLQAAQVTPVPASAPMVSGQTLPADTGFVQPNQEPTFSTNNTAIPITTTTTTTTAPDAITTGEPAGAADGQPTAGERPEIPKSGAPPVEQPSTVGGGACEKDDDDDGASSVAAAIEPDVGGDLSSTTPAPLPGPGGASALSTTTATSQATATATTGSLSVTDAPTTSAPASGTTTTATSAQSSEASQAASTTGAPKGGDSETDSAQASSERKKRTGLPTDSPSGSRNLASSVEYAGETMAANKRTRRKRKQAQKQKPK